MGKKGEPAEEADIQVVSPGVEVEVVDEAEEMYTKSSAKKAMDMPSDAYRKAMRKYRRLNNRDKMAVLIFVLVVILVAAMLTIWSTGGGLGPNFVGPEIRPISDWNIDALDQVDLTEPVENSNLEGQQTPYLVPLSPEPGEIYFVTHLNAHVTWTDESTPPSNTPAIGYTNQPDGFQLFIILQDSEDRWESAIEFNSVGSSHEIVLPIVIADYMNGPIPVAKREGADYLPRGYVENIRFEFIVRTDECGEWTTNDPRPPIGDAGNHFTFEWTVTYRVADSTNEP
jgi:hypothetical protein